MKRYPFALLLVLSMCLPYAHADLVVENFEQEFRIVAGEYQLICYHVHVRNTGAQLKRVVATIESNDEQIKVLNRKLRFGRIEALHGKTSRNKLVVVAPLSVNVDGDLLGSTLDLSYRFRFDVTLQGQVVDDPIPNAQVTADVGGSQTVVVADAQGSFTVDLTLATFDDFVSFNAIGGPGQDDVELVSLVGSAGDLHDATGGGVSVLTADDVQSLDVTHVTTAKTVLSEAANGGAIASTTELSAAELEVDTLELLRLAATLKVIIDDPAVMLPAGFATTLSLARDPAAADAFAADLQANNAASYNAALSETLAGAASGGFVPTDIEAPIYSTILRNLGVIVGDRLVFNADGTAQRTDARGTFDATWSISPTGTLLLEPVAGELVRSADGFSLGCVPIVNSAVRTQTVYLGSEFNLLLRGSSVDLVTERSESFQRFPENPECPPTAPVTAEPNIAFRWIDEAGSLDYSAADFAGTEVVLNFWSSTGTRATLGNVIRESGQDFFAFNANGTGTTRITGRDFNWTIDPDGHLEIAMVTGEFNEYISLGKDVDGDVGSALNIGTTANGTFAFRSLQLAVDPGFTLAPAIIVGPTFVSGSREQNTSSPRASKTPQTFQFLADGSWLQNGVPPFNDPAAAWSNPGGRLEFTLTAFGFTRQDVSWAPVAVIGDRYWVIEARQLGAVFDTPFVDLGTVTGFLTYYRATP